jgi:hypothetical protein
MQSSCMLLGGSRIIQTPSTVEVGDEERGAVADLLGCGEDDGVGTRRRRLG